MLTEAALIALLFCNIGMWLMLILLESQTNMLKCSVNVMSFVAVSLAVKEFELVFKIYKEPLHSSLL